MTEQELVTLARLVLKFAAVLANSQDQQEACIDIAVGSLTKAQDLHTDDEKTAQKADVPF